MKTTLNEALVSIAKDLSIDSGRLIEYVFEDTVGGYSPLGGTWPSGSIWEVEGKILYAITRTMSPETVVEVGSNYGCSTSHFLSAMDANNLGRLFALDLSFDKLRVQSPRLTKIRGDGLQSALPLIAGGVVPDILFEDGPHSIEFTRDILKAFLPIMRLGGLIIIHDVDHFLVGGDVTSGARAALGDFQHFLVDPSDCGLGYWVKR
jgi:hypothetical protein